MTLKEQKKKKNELRTTDKLKHIRTGSITRMSLAMLRLNVYFASLQAEKLKRPCMHFPTSSNYAHWSLKHSRFSVLKI